MNPIHLTDGYKTGHRPQYPNKTTLVYSNFTARGTRIPEITHVVVFAIQYWVRRYLINEFDREFFGKPKSEVVGKYKRRLDHYLGIDAVSVDHIEALHDLQHLPLVIKALPEGSVVPIRVPFLTIENTLPEFFWLTNFLETMLSTVIWHPITVASIAYEYRKRLQKAAHETSDMLDFVQWQGHDFSMRGQTSIESALVAGSAHLLSFTGTDTLPAIDFLEEYYGANVEEELVGGSVAATEHSVMCFGGKESEIDTFRRLITEVYPKGIVSIVSDTWDYWGVLTKLLPQLKETIMDRDGKVVIRPDSGDPVKILCGDPDAPTGSPEEKGTIEVLWDLFGGTINSKGYKQLDGHIGAIYGDSITLDRCSEILARLAQKKFASTNVVFGIGSYTYQYVTRDTFGMAVKATAGYVDGEPIHAYKDPKTDNGLKKSARGWISVVETPYEEFSMVDQLNDDSHLMSLSKLKEVFRDGWVENAYGLRGIRRRLLETLQ